MKLSELTPGGIKLVTFKLEQEDREWHRHTWWQPKETGSTPAELEMQQWYHLFTDFRAAVLSDSDIEEAFAQWVNDHHKTDFDVEQILAHQPGLLNVPQYGFLKVYEAALRLFRESNEQPHESQT